MCITRFLSRLLNWMSAIVLKLNPDFVITLISLDWLVRQGSTLFCITKAISREYKWFLIIIRTKATKLFQLWDWHNGMLNEAFGFRYQPNATFNINLIDLVCWIKFLSYLIFEVCNENLANFEAFGYMNTSKFTTFKDWVIQWKEKFYMLSNFEI